MDFRRLAEQYSNELFQRILPYWFNFSIDTINGGYFNVLSSSGEIVSTDKWVLMQLLQMQSIVAVYETSLNNDAVKDYIKHGHDFLTNILDFKKKLPEIVDCTGRVVKYTTDFVVEAEMISALVSVLSILETESVDKQAIVKLLKKRDKAHQLAIADISGERQFKNLDELTAIAKALLACRQLLSQKVYIEKASSLVNELSFHFWEQRADVILENVYMAGGYSECLEGRSINPGKIFETALVFIELAKTVHKKKTINDLIKQVIYIAETTWDEKYGGYYNTVDIKSWAQVRPEANFKTLRTHTAALSVLLKVYSLNKKSDTLKLWQRTHDYVWLQFTDKSKEGEWLPVLDRHGEPVLNLKATPSHCAYYSAYRICENIKMLNALADN